MLAKKYQRAIIFFICILVMLLILGLYFLGSFNSDSTFSLANLTGSESSRNAAALASTNQTNHLNNGYRYPIFYDKQTGSSETSMGQNPNNNRKLTENPLMHYLQEEQPSRQPPPVTQFPPPSNPFVTRDNFFLPTLQSQSAQPINRHPVLVAIGPTVSTEPPALIQHPPTTLSLPQPRQQSRQQASADASNNLLSKSSDAIVSATNHDSPYRPPIFAVYNPLDAAQDLGKQQLPQIEPPGPTPSSLMMRDEYQARQARLQQQARLQANLQDDENSKKSSQAGSDNLLADPYQQQKHKQLMLDRDHLFDGKHLKNDTYEPIRQTQKSNLNQIQIIPSARGPSYTSYPISSEPSRTLQPTTMKIAPIQPQQQPISRQLQPSIPSSSHQKNLIIPTCAISSNGTQANALFCNEDREYPTNEIMKTLELYAADQGSIEQLMPQNLIYMYLSQQQKQQTGLTSTNSKPSTASILDSLQKSIQSDGEEDVQFPTNNYDPMCRSTVFMAQPRRAKNLNNQWKVIVNLPGHKYRGVAVSQMVRVEECSQPMVECSPHLNQQQLNVGNGALMKQMFAKTRCLQHYDNQRLLSWTPQLGLHLDIFRIPISCSCYLSKRT